MTKHDKQTWGSLPDSSRLASLHEVVCILKSQGTSSVIWHFCSDTARHDGWLCQRTAGAAWFEQRGGPGFESRLVLCYALLMPFTSGNSRWARSQLAISSSTWSQGMVRRVAWRFDPGGDMVDLCGWFWILSFEQVVKFWALDLWALLWCSLYITIWWYDMICLFLRHYRLSIFGADRTVNRFGIKLCQTCAWERIWFWILCWLGCQQTKSKDWHFNGPWPPIKRQSTQDMCPNTQHPENCWRLTGMLRAKLYPADRVHFDVDSEQIARYQAIQGKIKTLGYRCFDIKIMYDTHFTVITVVLPKSYDILDNYRCLGWFIFFFFFCWGVHASWQDFV